MLKLLFIKKRLMLFNPGIEGNQNIIIKMIKAVALNALVLNALFMKSSDKDSTVRKWRTSAFS